VKGTAAFVFLFCFLSLDCLARYGAIFSEFIGEDCKLRFVLEILGTLYNLGEFISLL